MKALVLHGTNNFFQVACEDAQIRRCTIKGKILAQEMRQHNPLAPGDYVEVEVDALDKTEAQILALHPRKNYFARFNEKTKSPQVLAANIDLILCLCTPDTPPFRPIFIDRVLVQAASQNIPVLIVLNKIDLPISEAVHARVEDWQRLGYRVEKVSAKNGTGIAQLIAAVKNKTVCIVGQSGVGKSSLLNAIEPSLQLSTAAVSEKYNKGSHTTTRGSVYRIPRLNLSIIDTPGIKNFVLAGIPREDIALYFPEMKSAIGTCKFGLSCSHMSETGCEIQKRLAEGKISPMRFESWLNMLE